MYWLLAFRLVLAGVLIRRLAADGMDVRRGKIPATRLIVPVIILIAALLVANQIVPRAVAAAASISMDVALLGACLWFAASYRHSNGAPSTPELRLEHALSKFFPFWFARLVSAELTILSHAFAGAKAFVDPRRGTMHSYIQGSKIVIAGVVMAVAVVPDAFFFWLLLPHKLWWLAAVLDVLDVWACFWLFGIYGTMVRRPHEIEAHRVVFRNGIWQRVDVDPRVIRHARVLGVVKRRKLARRGDASSVLAFGGVPIVEVVLDAPAREHCYFLEKPREVRHIFVASDAPDVLCSELLRLANAATSAPMPVRDT